MKKFSRVPILLLILSSLSILLSSTVVVHSNISYFPGILAADSQIICFKDGIPKLDYQTEADCLSAGGTVIQSNPQQSTENSPIIVTECADYSTPLAREYCNSPLDLLPAWRWNSYPLNVSFDGGIGGMVKSLFSAGPAVLADFFFLLSGFIWKVILYFINLATSTDIISMASTTIDTGFYSVAGIFFGKDMDVKNSSGILIIGVAILLFSLGRAIGGGKNANVVRTIVTFIVPITVMYGIAIISSPDKVNSARSKIESSGTGTFCNNLITGTPSWIGCIGTTVVDQVASQIATMPSLVSSSMANTVNKGNQKEKYSCEKYMTVLYDAYSEVANGKGGTIMSFNSGDNKANSATKEASLLWQRAWLSLWTGANFGTSDPRVGSATCHYLEYKNDIPASEQAMIARKAYQSGLPGIESEKAYAAISGGSASNGYPFYPWIACQGGNRSNDITTSSWEQLWEGGKNPGNGSCENWLKGVWINDNDGGFSSFLNWGKLADLSNDYNSAASKVKAPATVKSLMNAKAVVSTYRNDRVWDRVLLGLIAFLAAGAMAFVLGLVSLGAVVAQVGLVLLLIWLPVTLFLIAIPMKSDGKGAGLGKKLLKLTFGFMTSKFILLLTMLLIIQASTIVGNIIDSIGA